MRILIAPDSFKGSLSSQQAAAAMSRAVHRCLPEWEVEIFPLADGGEGTISVIRQLVGGQKKKVTVLDPLLRKRSAWWLKKGRTAYLELAQASGLPLLKPAERNPLETTTFGVGEMIRDALTSGCEEIFLGVGGSATSDGGLGALTALGVKFIDGTGKKIWPGKGKDLDRIRRIDMSALPEKLKRIKFVVLTDVRNVLTGPEGAAAVYAPQKGASPAQVKKLDEGLKHYSAMVKQATGISIERLSGAGAAGGIAGGLYAFLGAKLVSGVETILKLGHFEEKLRQADLVLTGEGSLDVQVKYGKALSAVFQLAEKHNVPVIVLAGSVSPEAYRLFQKKKVSLFSIAPGPVAMEAALEKAGEFLYRQAQEVLKVYLFGTKSTGLARV